MPNSLLEPGQPALLYAAGDALRGGAGIVFGNGLRCVGEDVVRLGLRVSSASGTASWGPGLVRQGGYVAGQISHLQVWYRDTGPPGSPCADGFNSSHGLELAWRP